MKIAERISRLGTETAFAVSAEAATFAAKGNKVYPFHLGDMNISTPSNVVEAAEKAIRDGKTGYCPNAGVPQLREVLAADVSASHGIEYTMENVAVQPGGKPTIGKFFLALMNPGDEVLYPNPGYPIYESQIEFHGGKAVPYGLIEGQENFELDLDAIEDRITPRTKLLVLNDLQNPTGAECSPAQFEKLAELVLAHDLYVLCDEAYFDIRYEGKSASFAALPGLMERCVILYTFSKKFAMTGWRLGAAIGPKVVIDVFAKLNVNDESCSSHFVQYGAIEGLTGDQTLSRQILKTLKERRDTTVDIRMRHFISIRISPALCRKRALRIMMIFVARCCTKPVYLYAPDCISAGPWKVRKIFTCDWRTRELIHRRSSRASVGSKISLKVSDVDLNGVK
jgi:aspartate/methionine/tyrosine aminotransferase